MIIRIAVPVDDGIHGKHLETLKTLLQVYLVKNLLTFNIAKALVIHDRVLHLRHQQFAVPYYYQPQHPAQEKRNGPRDPGELVHFLFHFFHTLNWFLCLFASPALL